MIKTENISSNLIGLMILIFVPSLSTGVLTKIMVAHKTNRDCPALKQRRPTLLRALFTIGLLCKHFDLDSKEMGETKVII